MAHIVWTRRALADLNTAGAYAAGASPAYAELLVRRLLGAVERLSAFPDSGRRVPELGDDAMREIVYRGYRILYLHLPGDDRVEVLTVFHSSRSFGSTPGLEAD